MLELLLHRIYVCTKLGWRKFRRHISEFIATLAEFSPVMILLDRRQFCQCRAYENAATAENWPTAVTLHELLIWRNTCIQFTYAPSPSSFSILLTSTVLTQQIIPAQSAIGCTVIIIY